MADNKGNKRIGSFNFDAETKLEVMQRGGGGAGVGGENGLAAVNLVTGESTNAALAEKDETIAEQAGTIETQAGTIEEQAGEISDLEDEVEAKQAIIDAFPTIEALNVTANGTYSESGKAYSPVNVNVSSLPEQTTQPVKVNIVNQTGRDIMIFRPYLRNYELQTVTLSKITAGANQNIDIPLLKNPTGTYANIQIAADSQITPTITTPVTGLDMSGVGSSSYYLKFIMHQTDYQGARMVVNIS